MSGKIFLVLYVIVQILVSVLTEYSINNHRFFSRIGEKTRILRIFIICRDPFSGHPNCYKTQKHR